MVKLNGKLGLIVDKNPDSGKMLAAKLNLGGFSTTYVQSLVSAVSLLKEPSESFDFVLLHYFDSDPKVSLYDDILRSSMLKKVPIIGYSYRKDHPEIAVQAIKQGYDGFFYRPIEPDVLWDTIYKTIDPSFKLEEFAFAAPISETCLAYSELKSEKINTSGIQVASHIPLTVGRTFKLRVPLIEKLGLSAVDVLVRSCTERPIQHQKSEYVVELLFLSIPPNVAQGIRKYTQSAVRHLFK